MVQGGRGWRVELSGRSNASVVKAFEATKAAPSVKGFAVGRTIFADAAREWLAGRIDDEAAITEMAGRFGELTDAWLETRGLK